MEECHIFLHDFLQATQVIFKDTFMVHTALSQTKQESEKKTWSFDTQAKLEIYSLLRVQELSTNQFHIYNIGLDGPRSWARRAILSPKEEIQKNNTASYIKGNFGQWEKRFQPEVWTNGRRSKSDQTSDEAIEAELSSFNEGSDLRPRPKGNGNRWRRNMEKSQGSREDEGREKLEWRQLAGPGVPSNENAKEEKRWIERGREREREREREPVILNDLWEVPSKHSGWSLVLFFFSKKDLIFKKKKISIVIGYTHKT